jgi:hypothetical protein
MDLCLRTVILMDDIKSPEVQTVVATILDISEESVSRGQYAGSVVFHIVARSTDPLAFFSPFRGQME